MRIHWIVSTEIILALSGALAYYYWPQYLTLPPAQLPEHIAYKNDQPVITWPGRSLVAQLSEFSELLPAYLWFDYMRSRELLRGTTIALTPERSDSSLVYRLSAHLPDDIISGLQKLGEIRARHFTTQEQYTWLDTLDFNRDMNRTEDFVHAFNRQDFPKLDQIPFADLESYVRQFIRFKSSVDPRTWEENESPLNPPSLEDATHIAGDIIEVAEFYDLPIDLFLGIGAMENNFLDAPGDLNNAVWKHSIGPDDIVLQRKGRKAWILNSSIGIWQITRQSLRYAHDLYLCDTRDYSGLAAHLRPAEDLDMETLDSEKMTTYAGLILRDLVDYFNGDVMLAAGAYNGTKQHPNLQYAAGVENVAAYARRVIGNTPQATQLLHSTATRAAR